MKKTRIYTIQLDEYELNKLLAVLAYTAKKVEYREDASQHEELRRTAYTYHEWLSSEDYD